MRIIQTIDAGILSYKQGLKLQYMMKETIHANDCSGVLITMQHKPVYTVGIRHKGYSKEEEEKLRQTGADFYRTDRGGLITFHGPGQLVAYPIINLKHFKPSIRWYVHTLEDTIVNLCSQFALEASTSPLTGVWVNDKKVCAIGVHVSRYLTTHGLALNCNTNMDWFSNIIPCGIKDKGVTSLSELTNEDITVNEVLPVFKNCFQRCFNCNLEACNDNLLLSNLLKED